MSALDLLDRSRGKGEDGDPALGDEVLDELGGTGKYRGIRCPKCRWRPRAEDRWQCRCGRVWNTFDTRGVCPGCAFAWTITQCLVCHELSPHEAWYGDRA